MPSKSNLRGRSSTINNAFAISITPYIRPNTVEEREWYEKLDVEEGQCAYCLRDGNGRDHLKPLVVDGMPSGYITDVHNLVPCCQACNSSKGSKSFREWYLSPENIERLHKYGLGDELIAQRFDAICKFEEEVGAPLDYEAIVGEELWDEYKQRKTMLNQSLIENQEFCDKLEQIIMEKSGRNKKRN